MDANDLRLFEETLRKAAVGRSGAEFDTALDEVGWRDALTEAPTSAAVLFAIQGEHCATSSALDDVLAVALDLPPSATTAIVLPRLGTHVAPAMLTDDRVTVRGVGSRRVPEAKDIVITVGSADGRFAMTVATADLELRPVTGIDPAGGWVEILGELPAPNADGRTIAPWSAAVIAGQLALASELVANSRTMLSLARDHAVERVQFGVPIASFQAVRHRLAEALYAVESADAAVAASWEELNSYTAAMAKAIAGRSSKTVARHAQQVLAGMGFTSEHRFHHYLKRALVLDQLFGSSAALSEEIGVDVLRTGSLPPVRPL